MKKIIYALSLGMLAMPTAAGAQLDKLPIPAHGTFFGSVGAAVEIVLNYILSGIGILSLLGIVVGGLMYIISGGEETKTKEAKKIITASVTGLVIALVAYAIVNTISQLFGGSGGICIPIPFVVICF